MGTLSNRDIREFGADVKERIEQLRSNIGDRIDALSHDEGGVTRSLARITTTLPTVTWVIAAGAALVGSLALNILKKPLPALYVGMGVPAFLAIAAYQQLVKKNDRYEALSEDLH